MLVRFDPFRDVARLAGQQPVPAMDAFRQGNDYVVQFDLPGADPESVTVGVDRNVLTVRAERTVSTEHGSTAIVRERRHGSFTRRLVLGDHLDREHITASYDNGVLTVTIPVSEQAQPRQIPVVHAQTPTAPAAPAAGIDSGTEEPAAA